MNPNRNKVGQYSKSTIPFPFCKFCKIKRVRTRKNINCSEECQSNARRGTIGKNLGMKYSEEHRRKIALANWKGEKTCYGAKHVWMYLKYGRPSTCEHCSRDNLFGRSIHWANVSGKYKREREDWIRLCVPCHSKYDNKKRQT